MGLLKERVAYSPNYSELGLSIASGIFDTGVKFFFFNVVPLFQTTKLFLVIIMQ